MVSRCFVILLGLASITSIASAEDAAWGNLEGRFQIERLIEVPPISKAGNLQIKDKDVCGKLDIPDESLVVKAENLGIGNIFVFLRDPPEKIHPDLMSVDKPATLKFEQCRFVPHCQAIRTRQTLNVHNVDLVSHNAHFNPVTNTVGCGIIPPADKGGVDLSFTNPERLPVKTTCDIHPWMNCYFTVLDHPYCAITDKDGKFRLEKLPAGPHTFRVWHERRGYLIREWQVTIENGKTTTMPDIKVDPEKLSKK